MKRNVDLTEDMTFSQTVAFSFLNLDKIKDISLENNDYDYSVQRQKIIITGNKKARKEIKKWQEIENGCRCECCGANLNRIPWRRNGLTICDRCDSYLENTYGKRWPWENKEKIVSVVL